MVLTQGTCGRKKTLQGLELFAFSVSVFQREKVSSDLSHMHYRYMGRSGVKGQGFNNITFLRFGVLLAQRAQRVEMASDMWGSPGKHRCPYEFIDPNSQRKMKQQGSLIWPVRKEMIVPSNTVQLVDRVNICWRFRNTKKRTISKKQLKIYFNT